MPKAPLRVGVIGVGHLGTRHAEIYAAMPGVRLVAVCDINTQRARELANTLRCAVIADYRKMRGLVDAASLAVPTSLHGTIGRALLDQAIHLLIEKPIATTLAEANALLRIAAKRRVTLQIGHVERFNAAIHTAMRYLTHPRFIEVHRLSPYPFRGTDVSVVLDVMIHDLDLILALVHSRLTRVEALGVPVLSDIHSIEQIAPAAQVLDVIQIPAFLCRQTDLVQACARTKKIVNVKKGQFLAPWDMKNVIHKIEAAGNRRILVTERGVSFGYNNLVSDFRSIPALRSLGYPVIFDATHSVQLPGGLGHASGGNAEYIPTLARCAVASGADALFMEVHENPKKAKSDGPNNLPLNQLERLLYVLKEIRRVAPLEPA